MFKNIASQKVALFAFDTTTGAPKTGDGANLTPYVSKDLGAVTALGTATATEMDATNAKGWYSFVLTQAETNADALLFTGKSSTSNISIVGLSLYTTPNRFSSLVIDAAGLADANTVKLGPTGAGTAQTAKDVGASATQTGDNFARQGAPAGASVSADIAAIKSDTGTVLTDVNTGAGAIYTRLGAPAGASIAADIAAVKTDSAAVNTALTGAQAEPGQGAPAVNASVAIKIAYLYKAWRNKKTQTGTTQSLFADDTVTVDQKATVSDDGTTMTVGKVATGP